MKKERGKIIKISFQYENAKESLNNEEAEKWLTTVNEMCAFLQNRNPFEKTIFEWNKES